MDEGKSNTQLNNIKSVVQKNTDEAVGKYEPVLTGIKYDGIIDMKNANIIAEENLIAREVLDVASESEPENTSYEHNQESDLPVYDLLDLEEKTGEENNIEQETIPAQSNFDNYTDINKDNYIENHVSLESDTTKKSVTAEIASIQNDVSVKGARKGKNIISDVSESVVIGIRNEESESMPIHADTDCQDTDNHNSGLAHQDIHTKDLDLSTDSDKWDFLYATEFYQSMNNYYAENVIQTDNEQKNLEELERACNVEESNPEFDVDNVDTKAYNRLGILHSESHEYEKYFAMAEMYSNNSGFESSVYTENNRSSININNVTANSKATHKRSQGKLDIQNAETIKEAAMWYMRKANVMAETIKEDVQKENEKSNKGGLKNVIKDTFLTFTNTVVVSLMRVIFSSTAGIIFVVLFVLVMTFFIIALLIISILSDPISFYFDSMKSDVVNNEAYITKVLDSYYSQFETDIDKYINTLMKEVAPEEKEVLQLDGTVNQIDDEETGDTNYNDLIVVYLTKMYAETNISPIKNGETYLTIDTSEEQKVLRETFDEMNYYTAESEIVYSGEYWQLNYDVEIKKLDLDEWKVAKGEDLTDKQLQMLDKLRKTDITSLSGTLAISGDFNAAASIFTDSIVSPFYVYSQSDSRWGNSSYYTSTLRKSGCGPSSCAMVISSLTGMPVTPLDVAKTAMKNGTYYIAGAGSTYSLIGDMCTKYGLSVKRVARTEKETINVALREGKLCICIMGPGDFTSGGHFIVLRGITNSGYYLVGDSAGSKGVERMKKSWSPDVLLKQVRNIDGGGVWIISKKDSK